MSNLEARAIDVVERSARRYWRSEASGEVILDDIWISERRGNDLIVRVAWRSDDPRVTLQGDMIYTVSVLDGEELDIIGPEW